MDGKVFIDYANLSYDRAYESLNCIGGIWKERKDRIIPLYKQLKYKTIYRSEPIQYINTFINPEDKDAEWLDDLKCEHWEF